MTKAVFQYFSTETGSFVFSKPRFGCDEQHWFANRFRKPPAQKSSAHMAHNSSLQTNAFFFKSEDNKQTSLT